MVRIMNYAYYMLYELITYIQIFFGNVGYYTAYPFYALFNKGHVLWENREIMNQKYMNHTSYSVSYYASGIFYRNIGTCSDQYDCRLCDQRNNRRSCTEDD